MPVPAGGKKFDVAHEYQFNQSENSNGMERKEKCIHLVKASNWIFGVISSNWEDIQSRRYKL
jgi:hypothetical protein